MVGIFSRSKVFGDIFRDYLAFCVQLFGSCLIYDLMSFYTAQYCPSRAWQVRSNLLKIYINKGHHKRILPENAPKLAKLRLCRSKALYYVSSDGVWSTVDHPGLSTRRKFFITSQTY